MYKKYNLPDETQKVFDEAKTGRLYDGRSNKLDLQHREYNRAVGEAFDKFLTINKIDSTRMTPDQAQSFVSEILDSKDPRIKNYDMLIQLREIMQKVFRRFRGRE